MKRFLLLLLHLLLLVVPASASAYEVYDITCENVVSIRIERLKDTVGNITSLGDYHTVYFELTPHAAEAFVRLRDASPMIPIMFREKLYPLENLRIISHRRPIALRAFALTAHGDHGITFIAVKEHDAFDLARTVCPALTPAKVLVDGRLVDPAPADASASLIVDGPPPTSAGLAFDISCGNVSKVIIIRDKARSFDLRTEHDFVHSIFFKLKPEAEDALEPLMEASKKLNRQGGEHYRVPLAITANGQPLRSDAPEVGGGGSRSIHTFIINEQDAFESARAVCPTAPIEFIVLPKWSASEQQ